jgi:5-formyltetrahydrofolate cyclo-ligase
MSKNINQKQILRKDFQAIRSSLSRKEVEMQSKIICQNFIDNLLNKFLDFQKKTYGLYLSAFNEVDTTTLKNYFICNNIKFAYPKINDSNHLIDFVNYQDNQCFKANSKFSNIYEPITGELIIPDYIITPLLAFNSNLTRLGMGKGYYDRTIFQLKLLNSKIKTIGLAYDFQESQSSLFCEKHDQTLDFIVSTKDIFFLD